MSRLTRGTHIAAGVLWLVAFTAAAQSVSGNDVLDVEEAAALLRVKPGVVLRLAESHGIPARRVGDEWRFWRAALLEWLKGEAERTVIPEAELKDITAKGMGQDPVPQAPPPKAASAMPTVGERPATPTTEEIALRDQRVLLAKGAATIDFATSYGRSEQTIFPVVRAEEKGFGVSGTLRYGLADDLQLTMRVPAIWRRTTTFADASVSGTNSPRTFTTRTPVASGASASLLGVAWREAVGRPTVIWSVDSVMSGGNGDRGLGGGLVLSKSYDPSVLFAGVNYLYGLHINPPDSRYSLAKQNYGFQVGYTYAINDTLALSTVFLGSYRNSRSPDGIAIPPSRENYDLQLGTTWLVAGSLFMEPAVAMRLGGDNPGLTLSLNFSRSFRWRSKRSAQ